MSRLSRLALSKRSVTLLFAGALFLAGISAWGSLKQELLPDIEFPVITVVAPYPGAGSSDVTAQVTKPIEQAIGGVPRLEFIQSTSSNSIALVVTQFAYGTNVKETTAAIKDAVAKANLPANVEPTVQALNINASPIVIASIAATTTDGLGGLAAIARTEILPEISAIDGVARADLTGGLEERLFVTLDPAKLAASGLSTQQVVSTLQANNLTIPSGQLPADGSRTAVSTIGRLTSAEAIAGLVVGYERSAATTPGGPAASSAPGASATTPAPSTAPAVRTPITLGGLGTVKLESVVTAGSWYTTSTVSGPLIGWTAATTAPNCSARGPCDRWWQPPTMCWTSIPPASRCNRSGSIPVLPATARPHWPWVSLLCTW